MSRSFSGTGRVNLPSITMTNTMSVMGWAKAPGTTSDPIWNVTSRLSLEFDASDIIQFITNSAQWNGDMTGITVANWNHYAVTYDGSSTANDPIIYINGTSVTVTETNPPESFLITAAAGTLGNFPSGSAPFEGSIAHCAMNTVILTAGEINIAMRRGVCWRGIYRYYPLYGNATEPDYSGNVANSSSITATSTITDNPPIAGPWYVPNAWSEPLKAAPAVTARPQQSRRKSPRPVLATGGTFY